MRLLSRNILLTLGMLTFFIFSCKDKEKTGFTEEEKILYDSLKTIAFKDIRDRTDSICRVTSDSLYNTFVDSLLSLRKKEIEALFNEQ
jgi:hypothetical protein